MPPSDSAARSLPHRPFRLLGGAALALVIAGLVIALLIAILRAVPDAASGGSGPDIGHLLRMTSLQAGLTTVLSLAVGILLAWALNRLRFPGRELVVALFASAIVTPGVIVAFGLLTVWGRSGWVSTALSAVGLPLDIPIFGLPGIIAAHVVLDGALAARILLARIEAVPTMRLKTGQSLGLAPWTRFRVIDWPSMRGAIPGLGAIIFLLAFTSFPIVLLLGGGPGNETLEVAIYSAVRLDFDLQTAVKLALVQIGVCGTIIVAASLLPSPRLPQGASAAAIWADRGPAHMLQVLVLVIALLAFGLPLLGVLIDGLGPALAGLARQQSFWVATGTSLGVAVISAALTVLLAIGLALARAATAHVPLRLLLQAPAFAYLAVPGVVLSLGFFLLVRDRGIEPGRAGPAVVVIANSLLSLPFALATLGPKLEAIAMDRGRLIRALGLSGLRQYLLVEYPLIGRDLGVALALAFCFSLGDLGVIALFGTEDFMTLPLLMVRALGAYRSDDAAGIAAVLLVLTMLAFSVLPLVFERVGRAAR